MASIEEAEKESETAYNRQRAGNGRKENTMKISKTLRALAFVMSLVMIICSLPALSYADMIKEAISDTRDQSSIGTLPSQDEVQNERKYKRVGDGIYEVTELRDEYTKHIRFSDGSYMAVSYDMPVHRLDKEGKWQDIDNSISADALLSSSVASAYKTGDSRVSFGGNKDKLLVINEDGYTITLGAADSISSDKELSLDATSKAVLLSSRFENKADREDMSEKEKAVHLEKLSSSFTYENAISGADIEYVLSSNSVKENIIIKSKSKDGAYTYGFVLSLSGLNITLLEDGSAILTDKLTGEGKYIIPAPYMYDANGEESYSAEYSVVPVGRDKYLFTVSADSEWIESDEREFPITLDPSIEVQHTNDTSIDAYVSESAPTMSYQNNTSLKVGANSSGKEYMFFVKHNTLPTLPDGAFITKATLSLYESSVSSYNSANSAQLVAYTVLSSWTESIKWNDYSSGSVTLSESAICNVPVNADGYGVYLDFDVTKAAKIWQGDSTQNHGIAIRTYSKAHTIICNFNSSENTANKPVYTVEYRIHKGIEDYWSYTSQGTGIAGTGHVNNKTGELVFTVSGYSTTDDILPYAPSLVYSQSGAYGAGEKFASPMGKWSLSTDMYVEKETIMSYLGANSTETRYLFRDADGTPHYFNRYTDGSTTYYFDEDGLGLTLTELSTVTDSVKYKITNDYDDTLCFDANGRLIRITDAYGNKRDFVRNSAGRVTSVTLTPKSNSAITQLTFAYTSDGYIDYIDYPQQNRRIDIAYSSGKLTAVIYKRLNGSAYATDATATYTYSGDKLISAEDSLSGYSVVYTYNGDKVSAIREYADGQELGQSVGQGRCYK